MKKIIINANKQEKEVEKITFVCDYLMTEKACEGFTYGRSCSVFKDTDNIFYVTDDEYAPYITKIGTEDDLTAYFEEYA